MLPNLPKRALDAEWDYWKEQWGSLSRLDDVSAWIAKLAEAWKRVDEEEEESAEVDEIDRNVNLSRDDKYRQRSKTADEAIADFEASKTLARAREAVELAVANRNCEGHVSPEIAQDSEAMLKARKEAERGWERAKDKIAERASLTKGPDRRR